MNRFHGRLNAVAARLPFTATLDPETRAMIEDIARGHDLDPDELAEEVERTAGELAAAGVTDPDAQVRYICQRDNIPVEELRGDELYGNG